MIRRRNVSARNISTTEPDHTWGLEDLGEHAHCKHEEIVQCEKTLAPAYHGLGQVLELARKQVNRGQWEVFLVTYGIDRVRACRARTIFRTFSSAKEVSGLTVQEAYEKRQKRQVHRRTSEAEEPTAPAGDQAEASPSPERTPTALDAYLTQVRDGVEKLINVVAFMGIEERKKRFSLYQAALKQLQSLGQLLGDKNAVRPADSEISHPEINPRHANATVTVPLVASEAPLADHGCDELEQGVRRDKDEEPQLEQPGMPAEDANPVAT